MAEPTKKPDDPKLDSKDAKKAPEPDFLTVQQDDAKAAIGRVIADMGKSLKGGADVAEWARQYPLITAGSAAVAGFLVGMLIAPKKGHPQQNPYASLKDLVSPAPDPGAIAEALAAEKRKSDKPGFVQNMIREAMKAVGPILAGVMSGKTAQPEGDNGKAQADGNGGGAEMPSGFGVYRDAGYGPS